LAFVTGWADGEGFAIIDLSLLLVKRGWELWLDGPLGRASLFHFPQKKKA
jgi:hypothetical protein